MQDINKQVARSVRFDIAKDRNEEFHKLFKSEVLPVLKKQDGFKDELLLVHDQHDAKYESENDDDERTNGPERLDAKGDRRIR